ncbi:MAG: hypothetical protein AAF830_05115 [Pseudomonadota bacterium]
MSLRSEGRFIIVDPSLSDLRGHHYQLTLNADSAAREGGAECVWLVNHAADRNLLKAHPQARPAFKLGMYDQYKRGAKSKDISLADEMTAGLLLAIDELGVTSNDRLFFHTCDGATYEAAAAVVEELALDVMPAFHLCTPYDPVGVMPNRTKPGEVTRAIDLIGSLGLIGVRVFLYAENDLLANHLSQLWRTPVTALNLPMPAFSDEHRKAAALYRQDTLNIPPADRMVCVLGSARIEKGFNLLPDIVRRTFEFAGESTYNGLYADDIQFVIQATPQIVGRDPVIQKAIDRLQEQAAGRVTLLEHSLEVEEYRSVLLASDIVLMPYEPAKYRVRGSGIISEALTAGKFAVASEGSYPGHMASLFGGGTGAMPRDMARAILEILASWETRERVKHDALKAWTEEHTPARYFQRIASRDVKRGLLQ